LLWSPSSHKVLVAIADQVHVFSALDSKQLQQVPFHAAIRNPSTAGSTARPTHVQFGAGDREVCLWSAFGLKLSIFDLAASKAVEIGNPKFHHRASAPRGFSVRPSTSHVALLTRTAGKDVVSIHDPSTREVVRSWQPDTVDAQGVMWSGNDGQWLVIWESPAQGRKVLFYTPDGHLFRSWIGRHTHGTPTDEAETVLGAGARICQLSPNASLAAVGDYSRCICILDATVATETVRLRHPLTVAPKDTLQVRMRRCCHSRQLT
jgi:hypothetical protein